MLEAKNNHQNFTSPNEWEKDCTKGEGKWGGSMWSEQARVRVDGNTAHFINTYNQYRLV